MFIGTLVSVLLLAQLAPAAPAPSAHPPEVIRQASALVRWCRAAAEAHYVGRGITPYQWTSTHHDYAEFLHVDGRLRADGQDVVVKCKLPRGAYPDFMTLRIEDPRI